MHIFIDESGTFVPSDSTNAWNSIAAYVLPEGHRRKMVDALDHLKREVGSPGIREIKLKHVSEHAHFRFLSALSQLDGVLFSVLIDMGANDKDTIQRHQQWQAAGITKNIGSMKYEAGRGAVQNLSDEVIDLSPQLYVQLQCQIILVEAILRSATLYFVQRRPETLGHFRWRIDQKNVTWTKYERTFFTLTPAILQTKFILKPWVMLDGADYGGFNRFKFPPGEEPTFLRDQYGIDSCRTPPDNLGKLCRENFEFVDSKQSPGVQVADLLAAGLRRTLRQGFADNDHASRLLGSIMVQSKLGQPPVTLMTLGEEDCLAGTHANLVRAMISWARNMLV